MLFATSLSNFNFLDYDWQLIDGVHCPIWYSSLQLSVQEQISYH